MQIFLKEKKSEIAKMVVELKTRVVAELKMEKKIYRSTGIYNNRESKKAKIYRGGKNYYIKKCLKEARIIPNDKPL